MKKKTLNLFIVLVFVLTSFSSLTASDSFAKAKVQEPVVTVEQAILDEMDTNGSASYWIQFKNTADLSPAYAMSWSDRGWFVYETLKEQAEVSQAQVNSYLTASKVDFQSYWINNSIFVKNSTNAVLNDIQKFEGVESIQAQRNYILYEPDTSAAVLDNGINAVEPNLTHINADDVWGMGIDGSGLVVANIDTGVRYTHEALVDQYRGNDGVNFDHNYSWWDPYGDHPTSPADDNGHGSHTMGTMVGDDGNGNQIGIAPGADWIACRGCNTTSCTDTALLSCGQFIAAPTDLTGNNANPDLRPNAVNNSWGDCSQTYDNWYAGVINAWVNAGIYPIFSNGNNSNCGYSRPPGLGTVGNPARSGNVTGVGSSGEQNGQYATHSNWGPTDNPDTINATPGFENMKPQVLAPGVSIRSSVPDSDTAYEDGWSGTSMSAPHVTGLVALIWQAAPCLIGDYAATELIIESTAVDMVYDDGSPDTPDNFPNYATGWGEIDALAAVNVALGMCSSGTLKGTVTDGTNPVQDVKIFADNGTGYTKSIYTAEDGTYSTSLPAGTYTLVASKYGYESQTVSGVVITEGVETTQNFTIPALAATLVFGTVYEDGVEGVGLHGYPLYSAIKIMAPGFNQTIYTDPFTGAYEIELLDGAEYSFTIIPVPNGFTPTIQTVTPTGLIFTKDFHVKVGAECSAPGYSGSGVNEGFETPSLPEGWVNYDYNGSGGVWRFDDPKNRGNLTPGGDGGFAILDSDYYGYGGAQDAGLRTPVMDFTNETLVTLEFDTYFRQYSGSSATVRVSNDGGSTWSDVWSTTTTTTEHVAVDISTHAAGKSAVIVEFKYVGNWAWYWEVDDVLITPLDCDFVTGGVVAGYVKDANDNTPIVGADVVSEDVSTQTFFISEDPASEGLYWAFQPTTNDPEDVLFTASKDLYGNDTKTVSIFQNVINRQDFTLGTGHLIFNPTSLEATMYMGDAPVTKELVITNDGSASVSFELFEKDKGFTLPSIPAFEGVLTEDTRPVSIGRDPLADKASRLNGTTEDIFKGILSGAPAFAVEVQSDTLMYIPDITNPGTWNTIGATMTSLFAGDFLAGDFTTLYAINYDNNNLYTVNTTTGTATLVGASTPPSGQFWTGLSGTPDGTLYGLTTDGSVSSLVTVNPATGAVTELGNILGVQAGIDLAYNTDDGMIYIVDIITDNLFRVDPETLTTTQIGSLGVDASYAQGMDFEDDSGVLYWAAYTTAAELRIIDTTTGASALVGAFPSGTEVDCLAFATSGSSDVPWFSEDPVSGTVGTENPVTVEVTFDPTGAGLNQPGDYLAELKVKHNSPYTYPNIPVTLHLIAPDNYGTFNGHVKGMEVCDVNPTPLEGATVNFRQNDAIAYTTTTNAEGYYSYALPEGTYDIEVISDGYVSKLEQDQVAVGGQTTTVDVTLRLEAPCLVVSPTSLEQTQPSDTITTQTLTIINTGAGDAIVELMEIDGGFQPPAGSTIGKVPSYEYSPERDLPGLDRSKTMPIQQNAHPDISSGLLDVLINEGFETSFPPSGWTQVINNPSYTWEQSSTYAYEGSYGARAPWDYDQDEWLLTPELALAEGALSVYSQGSVYWCRDTNDYCDLNVWLVIGEVGGGDDIFVKNLEEDWSASWTWTLTTIDLTPFLPGEPVRIGFQYIGDDGATAAIDSVVLDGVEGLDVPWLSEDPVSMVILPNDSFDVTVGFDSTGLFEGDYLATLRIKELSGARVDVPVTLHVINLRNLYLPLILK